MHHRMPPSKTGWPILNVVIFPPGRPKTVTTSEIIDQIHELILEDRRISTKSIAEQLGISREWVGSIIHEHLGHAEALRKVGPEMPERGSKTSMVPVVWANLEFFRREPNDFLSRLVTMDETWLYHYDPETKQQSMEWRYSGSPRPTKIPSAKICWKSSRLEFFLDEDGILLIDYLPKGQTVNAEYYSSLLVQLKDILKESAAGRSPRVSCSCTTIPRLTGHLQPKRNWPTCASSV